jgi:deoxyribodipyrimidine photo-lyase
VNPVLVWFRHDLRLQDNPALDAALKRGVPIVPVYVLDDAGEGPWKPGGASRWWLHHSLASLDASLRGVGSRLTVVRGDSLPALLRVARAADAGAVFWNRRYEPLIRARDEILKKELLAGGIEARSFNGSLLFEPHAVTNKQGGPFQVFTPFWKHCRTRPVEAPIPFKAKSLSAPAAWPDSLSLADFELLPKVPWDAEFAAHWRPGEEGAVKRLNRFARGAMDAYRERRDIPGEDGTSRLSPWLRFGELSPRQIWAAAEAHCRVEGGDIASGGAATFLSEVGWREFGYHLLYHFPHTPGKPLRAEFARFPWAKDPGHKKLKAWRLGRTGYPIVDAGMRQLWRTGWMHNRVRMIAASFLVKHLRLPWNEGAEWFWDTLVDADLASNTLGWQWTAGCGADAAPYFRIFAPVTQGQRFDANGEYVREFVPELAKLPAKWIHAPWEAPHDVLAAAGVSLGKTYPHPIVDHAAARAEALQAFALLKEDQEARESA